MKVFIIGKYAAVKDVVNKYGKWKLIRENIQGGSNMTGTDLCVNKPHCAAAVRP